MCERFSNDEFCHLCAHYVKQYMRNPITDKFQEMYYDVYGEEMNLDGDAPSTICDRCKNSVIKFALGEINYLCVSRPAKWGECRGDHRDCFYHLVKVNYENARTTLPRKEWFVAYRPPKFS